MRSARVAIATSHGLHYYRFARSLYALGMRFDSIAPSCVSAYDGDLVLCTRDEAPGSFPIPALHEDASEKHPAVLCAMMLQKIDQSQTGGTMILGVDPGSRTGLSVFCGGREIGTSVYTSVEGLVRRMAEFMAGAIAEKIIIRIGNGNMQAARAICEQLRLVSCTPFELELVDEYGTTPRTRNLNRRGTRDMHSAKSIAQRTGHRSTMSCPAQG